MAEITLQKSSQALQQALSEFGYSNPLEIPSLSPGSGAGSETLINPATLQTIAISLLVAGLLVVVFFIVRNALLRRTRGRQVIAPPQEPVQVRTVPSLAEFEASSAPSIVALLLEVLQSLFEAGIPLDRRYQTLGEIRPLLLQHIDASARSAILEDFDVLSMYFRRARYRGDALTDAELSDARDRRGRLIEHLNLGASIQAVVR